MKFSLVLIEGKCPKYVECQFFNFLFQVNGFKKYSFTVAEVLVLQGNCNFITSVT